MFIWNDEYDFYYYADLNSTNGTILNGVLLKSTGKSESINSFKLNDFVILSVDSINDVNFNAVAMLFTNSFNLTDNWKAFDISYYEEVLIMTSLFLENMPF